MRFASVRLPRDAALDTGRTKKTIGEKNGNRNEVPVRGRESRTDEP